MVDFINEDGQVAWIAEHADLDEPTVRAVLELEMDYLFVKGIARRAGYTPRYYSSSDDLGPPNVLDTEMVADDAEQKLGIRREIAKLVLLTELQFLEMRGLA